MGWRDRLLPAQFKGVPFSVDAASVSKGRRVSVRRLAGRGGSVNDDLGREPDAFEVQAFVWGDDYDQRRDDLEAAVVDEGPGILTLPTRGDLYVRVTSGPVTTERRTEGGYCEVRFSCVIEERVQGRVRGRPDTAGQLATAASRVRLLAAEDYEARASTPGLPERYLGRTRSAVDRALSIAGRVQVRSSEWLRPVTETSRSLDAVRGAATDVLSTPSLVATTIIDAVYSAFALNDAVLGGVDRASGAPLVLQTPFQRGRGARLVDAAAGAFRSFGEPFISMGESALAQRGDDNERAVNVLVRSAALSAQADALSRAQFDSSTFAASVLDRTRDELDQLVLLVGDALYHALEDLRAALTRHLVLTAARLPDAIAYAPIEPLPALLLAYELYEDLAMESDLIARNVIGDPLRAGGVLEVLRP